MFYDLDDDRSGDDNTVVIVVCITILGVLLVMSCYAVCFCCKKYLWKRHTKPVGLYDSSEISSPSTPNRPFFEDPQRVTIDQPSTSSSTAFKSPQVKSPPPMSPPGLRQASLSSAAQRSSARSPSSRRVRRSPPFPKSPMSPSGLTSAAEVEAIIQENSPMAAKSPSARSDAYKSPSSRRTHRHRHRHHARHGQTQSRVVSLIDTPTITAQMIQQSKVDPKTEVLLFKAAASLNEGN